MKQCSVLVALLALGTLFGRAQTNFGTQPLGSPTSLTITVFARNSGTVDQVKVLTMGDSNQDYVAGSAGSCAGTTIAAGQQCTQNVVFTPIAPGVRLGAVVLLDSSKRTLGTAYLYGQGKGPLAVFVPGNLVTVAGNGSWNKVNDGGRALSANLNLPSAVAVDAVGNLFIADREHHRIRKVDAATQTISTVAGNGNAAYSGDGGPATQAALHDPSGVALDAAGNIFISDTGNNAVRKVDAQTGIINTIAGTGTAGYTGDNGQGTSATLNEPWGVTVDFAGNAFIADTANHVVRKLDRNGVITTLAGTGFTHPDGSGSFSGDGGPAALARLNRPTAIAFDIAGNAYIADSNNNRVRMIDTTGKISTFAGTGVAGYSGDGGAAAAAQVSSPSGLCIDAGGNLYISDTQNQVIRKVNAHTGAIATVAGYAVGKAYDGGKWVGEQLYGPMALAVDGLGNLFVADYYNMRVREIQAATAVAAFSDSISAGDTSAPLKRWMENNGTAELTINSVNAGTNAAVDAATTSCSSASTLLQDRACSIGAEFAPAQQGDSLQGTIDLTANAINSPLQLILVGNALPENATTTTLSASDDPAYFGKTVTFTAAVTTGHASSPLDGKVTFYDGSTVLQSGSTLDSFGRATFSTSTLSIGTHTVTAKFGQDTRHSDSSSQPLSESIEEQTSVALTSSANPAQLGGSVTLSASVSILGGGNVPLDGSVAFYDGQNLLATVSIDQKGTASYATSKLTRGSHNLTAWYSGDARKFIYPSTSPAAVVNVLANSSVSLVSTSSQSTFGNAVTFTASVSSNGSPVTSGEVDLMDGSTQIGSANLAGSGGTAGFMVSSLAAGSHTMTATYKGSDEFQAATSVAIIQSVKKAGTAVSVSAPGSMFAAVPFTLRAAVSLSSGAGTLTGNVKFSDGATTLGTASIGQGNTATLLVSLAAGSHSIAATYSGDSNGLASSSNPASIEVGRAVTSINLATSASTPLVFSPVAFTAAVSSNGASPTGNLKISVDGKDAGVASIGATGSAFNQTFSTVGTHTVTLSYAGDSNTLPASSKNVTVSVLAIPTVTTLEYYTDASGKVVFFASASGANGPVPTGSVQFSSAGQSLGSADLNANGAAVLAPDLAVGTYTITAAYGGDTLHGGSKSQAMTVTTTVKPSGDFAISVNPASVSVKTSQSATVKLGIQSKNGFADAINLGCLSLPLNVSCHFVQTNVGLQASKSQELELTIETSAMPYAAAAHKPSINPVSATLLGGVFFPAGVLLGIVSWRARRRYPAAFLCIIFGFVAATLGLSGCGAQISGATATPGTYTIQIGGVGQASHVSEYETVTLTITK